MQRRWLTVASSRWALGLALSLTALPLAADSEAAGALLAGSCYGCHAIEPTNAKRGDGHIPTLRALSKDELLRTLLEFRSGQRDATLMQRITRGYTPAQLQAIASHLATASAQP